MTEKSVVASRKQKFTVAAFRGKCRWSKIICPKNMSRWRSHKKKERKKKEKKRKKKERKKERKK